MQQNVPADKSFVPTSCPVCQSTDVSTASKTVDEAAYWRCRACGEVWNVGRRQAENTFNPHGPWRARR